MFFSAFCQEEEIHTGVVREIKEETGVRTLLMGKYFLSRILFHLIFLLSGVEGVIKPSHKL